MLYIMLIPLLFKKTTITEFVTIQILFAFYCTRVLIEQRFASIIFIINFGERLV